MSYNITPGGFNRCIITGPNHWLYGKRFRDGMSEEAYNKWLDKVRAGSRKNATRPEWHQKMSEVTAGEKNPMFGHACTEFMTDEAIAQWHENLSKCRMGEDNPMYGKDSWAKCTPEEREDRKRRYSQSMKGKNVGRKMMQLPGTDIVKFVHPDSIQEYLAKGYLFSDPKSEIRKRIAKMKPLL